MLDRIVQYPGRYKLKNVLTNEEFTADLTRAEGTVTSAGTPYNKSSVLPDALATKVGLTNPTLAEFLEKITSVDWIYPVGSIYISVDANSPADIWGGTWVAFGTGRTLVGVDTSDTDFDTVEETGGEKTHTLSIAEIPSHYHQMSYKLIEKGSGGSSVRNVYGGTSGDTALATTSTGGGGAHNNVQPYITVYMWKRTA